MAKTNRTNRPKLLKNYYFEALKSRQAKLMRVKNQDQLTDDDHSPPGQVAADVEILHEVLHSTGRPPARKTQSFQRRISDPLDDGIGRFRKRSRFFRQKVEDDLVAGRRRRRRQNSGVDTGR